MTSERERNAALNHQEYLSRALTLESYPTMVFVELTENCNLSCHMCRSSKGYDRALDMSPALFDTIATSLFPRATLIGLNGWGESTILRDFPERLRRAVESGAEVRLVTNAHAMTPALWRLFFQGDNVVVVSFDSADPEMFAKLGRGNFSLVKRNLEQGVKIRDEVGRGLIYLNMVVNSYTLVTLPNVIRFAADLGLNKVVVNPIKVVTSHPSHLGYSVDHIPVVLDESAALATSLGVTLQLGGALDESLAVPEALPDTCENPWSNVLIEHTGRVTFCHHLLHTPAEYGMGSLAQSSFDDVWNGAPFQELRRLHVDAERSRGLPSRFQKCTWCYHNRYSDAEFPTEALNGREVSTLSGKKLYRLRPVSTV